VLAAAALALPSAPAVAQSDPGVVQTEHSIEHDGLQRHYIVARPTSLCARGPAVVLLHGGSQSMRTVLEQTAAPSRWLDLAAEFAFPLIIPNGFNVTTGDGGGDQQTWNDLRPSVGNPISEEDDAGFILAVLDREAERLGFDPGAVFITGSSNGGMMAYRMLIEAPQRFAAGAAFIANLPLADIPDPPSPTPVMIMNGDADPLMPWTGGIVGASGAPVRSAPDTVAYWRRVNGVDGAPTNVRLLPDIDPLEGARIVEIESIPPGGGPPPVVLYRMTNAGHAIPVLPTDPQKTLPDFLGVRCRDARGVDLAWTFFSKHRPPRSGDLDGSGEIDGADLGHLLLMWDATGASTDPNAPADLNGDNKVDGADLGLLLLGWGPCP